MFKIMLLGSSGRGMSLSNTVITMHVFGWLTSSLVAINAVPLSNYHCRPRRHRPTKI
jgi:hypothetical protein